MADKYDPMRRFNEVLSQWTGVPVEEIEAKQEPITEERLKAMEELDRKVHSLSREEALKRLHDWVEQDKEYR